MRIIDIDLTDVYISEIRAGFLRENEHTRLKFKLPVDLIGEYEYRISLQAGNADFLTDIIQAVEERVVIDLSSTLTAVPELKAQVIAIDDNSSEVGKSKVVTLFFDVSLPEDGIQPPVPGNPPVSRGLPPGGIEGEALVKESNKDFDAKWKKIQNRVIVPSTVFTPLSDDPTLEELYELFGGIENCRKIIKAINDGEQIVVEQPDNPSGWEPEMCTVVAAEDYKTVFSDDKFDIKLTFYSKIHHALFTIMTSSPPFPITKTVKQKKITGGILEVSTGAQLPDFRLEDVEETVAHVWSTSDVRFPVTFSPYEMDYIGPVEEPAIPDTFTETGVRVFAGSDKISFKFDTIEHDGQNTGALLCDVDLNNVLYRYAYAQYGIDGYINQGWNSYVAPGVYTAIQYSNIKSLAGAVKRIGGINEDVKNNILIKKIFPKGYYSQTYDSNNNLMWVYGLDGNPLTAVIDIVDSNGNSIIDDGIAKLPPPPQQPTIPVTDVRIDGQSEVNNQIVNLTSAQLNNIFEGFAENNSPASINTIVLEKDTTLYKINTAVTGSTIFEFSTANITIPQGCYLTFELMVELYTDPPSITFNDTIMWLDDALPIIPLVETRIYLFAFRTFDGLTYYGNLQGSWAVPVPEQEEEEESSE